MMNGTERHDAPTKPPSWLSWLFILSYIPMTFVVAYLLLLFPELTDNPDNLFITAVLCVSLVLIIVYFGSTAIWKHQKKPTLAQVFFCFTVFTSTLDVIFVGHMLGFWEMGSFYLQHGERYFNTAYGIAALGWDAVVHLSLQVVLAHQSLHGQSLKPAGLVWAGSVLNSLTPFLLGCAATGKYSADVTMATALNVPSIFVPTALVVKMFHERESASANNTIQNDASGKSGRSLASAIVAILVVLTHMAMFSLHILRAMSALGSDAPIAIRYLEHYEPGLGFQSEGTNIVLVQCLQNLFWLGSYHAFAMWDVISTNNNFLVNPHESFCFLGKHATDWSVLALGSHLNGFFVTSFVAAAEYNGPGTLLISMNDAKSKSTWSVAILSSVLVGAQAIYFASTSRRRGQTFAAKAKLS